MPGKAAGKSCGRRRVLLHFFEELVDALGVFLGIIEDEVKIGDAAKLQALQNFVADKIRGVFEGFDGAFLFGGGAAHADEHSGVAHILSDEHLIDDDGHFEARVLEFAGEHGIDFVGDLFADAFVAVIDGGHDQRTILQKTFVQHRRRKYKPRTAQPECPSKVPSSSHYKISTE